ncbi:hypothetical protein ABIB68_007835 [Bradyrhizobium sp. F1.2.2]
MKDMPPAMLLAICPLLEAFDSKCEKVIVDIVSATNEDSGIQSKREDFNVFC